MNPIVKFFNTIFSSMAEIVESSFLHLCLVSAPAVPSAFLGYNTALAFYSISGMKEFAILTGLLMVFTIESTGFLTMSNTMSNYDLYQRGELSYEKFRFSVFLSLLYLFVAITILVAIDLLGHGDSLFMALGIGALILAAVVYLSQADRMISRINSRKEYYQDKNKRNDAKEFKIMKLKLEHEQKMAAIEASKRATQPAAQEVVSESRLDAIYPNATTAKNIILHLRDNPDATSNKTQMAKDLGVSRKTLHTYLNLIKQYGDGDVQ